MGTLSVEADTEFWSLAGREPPQAGQCSAGLPAGGSAVARRLHAPRDPMLPAWSPAHCNFGNVRVRPAGSARGAGGHLALRRTSLTSQQHDQRLHLLSAGRYGLRHAALEEHGGPALGQGPLVADQVKLKASMDWQSFSASNRHSGTVFCNFHSWRAAVPCCALRRNFGGKLGARKALSGYGVASRTNDRNALHRLRPSVAPCNCWTAQCGRAWRQQQAACSVRPMTRL